jgi:1-acyl-sn-glycerol-3-phosphate acyltransferase
MRKAIEGSFTYLEIAACAVAFLPVLSAVRFAHRKDEVPRVAGRWLRRYGRATGALTPLWKFDIEGTPPADIDRRAYVVVSNHMSNADPWLLSWLPWDMQWIGKEELFRMPLFGWLMQLSGDIPLRRGEGESVRAMLAKCRHSLQHGLSVMIFPEGHRAKEGGVQPFKDGAFQLAVEEGAPILPIALAGTRGCMPKGSKWFGRAHAVARVLEPIETKGMKAGDFAEARELARTRVMSAVAELEANLARQAVERS